MNLQQAIDEIVAANPVKLVLSGGGPYKKITVSRKAGFFIAEKLTETQAFHEKLEAGGLAEFVENAIQSGVVQLNAWADGGEYAVKLAKSGRVLTNTRKGTPRETAEESHNRRKRYIIPEGADIPVLRDIGIFTRDGVVTARMYDKFRQINRFLEVVDDVYGDSPPESIRVLDFGCGKSYLTFLLYHYFTEVLGVNTAMLGLDLKADVIARCNAMAVKYGYSGLSFKQGDVAAFAEDFKADAVISLHACDTATDYALFHAVKNGAAAIFAVPCCQHELDSKLDVQTLKIFSRYGIIQERTAALMTDAIRGRLLTAAGYKTQLLEFIDFEHTPKNIMIRAKLTNISKKDRDAAYDDVLTAVREFGGAPVLLELMEGQGLLPVAKGGSGQKEP